MSYRPTARASRAAMALSALSGDEQGILFVQLCSTEHLAEKSASTARRAAPPAR